MNHAPGLVLLWLNQFLELVRRDERVSKRPARFEQAARDRPPDGDGSDAENFGRFVDFVTEPGKRRSFNRLCFVVVCHNVKSYHWFVF